MRANKMKNYHNVIRKKALAATKASKHDQVQSVAQSNLNENLAQNQNKFSDNSGLIVQKALDKLYEIIQRNKSRTAYINRFKKHKLPQVANYYHSQGIRYIGSGAWRRAKCPFHRDQGLHLLVRVENGAFRCLECQAKGGDVLAFHQQRYKLGFKAAALQLGAWENQK